MYGTQDASNLWQKHYTDLISKQDYRPGVSNRAVFYSQSQDARMLVHGDAFVLLADEDAAYAMLELLEVGVPLVGWGCTVPASRLQQRGHCGG